MGVREPWQRHIPPEGTFPWSVGHNKKKKANPRSMLKGCRILLQHIKYNLMLHAKRSSCLSPGTLTVRQPSVPCARVHIHLSCFNSPCLWTSSNFCILLCPRPQHSHLLSLTSFTHFLLSHTHFIRVYSPHPHRPSSLSTECWIFAQGIILYFFVYSFITYLNYGKRFHKANLLANCIFDDLVQAMILWQYLTVYSNSPLCAAKCVAVVGRTVFYYRKLCFRSWIYIFWQENQTVLKAPRTPCVFHSHTQTPSVGTAYRNSAKRLI